MHRSARNLLVMPHPFNPLPVVMNIPAITPRLVSLRSMLATGSLVAASIFQSAIAGPVVEFPDAGDTLGTAQDVRALGFDLQISGGLSNETTSPDWVDVYQVRHGNYPRFVASTAAGPGLLDDPVLFLFDSGGVGVAMDDEGGGFAQALIRFLGGVSQGDYFLAIAFAGMEALDFSGNSIFDTFGSGGLTSFNPLASWGGSPFALDPAVPGAYKLKVMSVDEPGTLLLAALALAAVARVQRRRVSLR